MVINSGTGNSGVHDFAGNALQGNVRNGNFVASINTTHNQVVFTRVSVTPTLVSRSIKATAPAATAHRTTMRAVISSKSLVHDSPIIVPHQLAQSDHVYDLALGVLNADPKPKRRFV